MTSRWRPPRPATRVSSVIPGVTAEKPHDGLGRCRLIRTMDGLLSTGLSGGTRVARRLARWAVRHAVLRTTWTVSERSGLTSSTWTSGRARPATERQMGRRGPTREEREMIMDLATTGERDIPRDRRWSVEEVSYYLGVPVGTLYSWRVQRRGPACRRIGRFLGYRPEDVTAWFAGLGDWPAAG
jgi:Helix-turn-helix domain